MAGIETPLGLLDEIQSLVSDTLQVVSYKWLSRNYLLSSNAAKRLLWEFVEKHGGSGTGGGSGLELEVVYTLSGWLKNDSSNYHITLVSSPKLSVQVYSVQASVPKDPAALWNPEFVQAEELFKQSFEVDNCFRDNRFCGISNSFVKRNMEGTPVSIVNPMPKTAGGQGQSKSNSMNQNNVVPQPQQNKVQESSPKVVLQTPNVVQDVKSETNGTGLHSQSTKPPSDKEKVPPMTAGKKKVQNVKSSSGTGGSLANIWSRASAKSKPVVPVENNNVLPNPPASAEAQICAREAVEGGSSDDDGQDVNFKRASNGESGRKRRVVFDFSDEDEYEDAVSLASPDIPKVQSSQDQKQSTKVLVSEKSNLNSDKQKEDELEVKEEIVTDRESNQPLREDSSVISKGTNTGTSSREKVQNCIPESDVNKKDNLKIAAPNSPKRKKVLKTRINERGREVTEVIWEGEETDAKKADSSMTKETNKALGNTVSSPPAAKKSPTTGTTAPSNPTGKAGNKKAGSLKDPKQGNILSFFKRV
ncbi:hypothetical protein ACB098_06G076400 [Castanea mollissima]